MINPRLFKSVAVTNVSSKVSVNNSLVISLAVKTFRVAFVSFVIKPLSFNCCVIKLLTVVASVPSFPDNLALAESLFAILSAIATGSVSSLVA